MNQRYLANSSNSSRAEQNTLWLSRLAIPFYCLFVSYCALVPLGQWSTPKGDILHRLLYDWVHQIYMFDVIQNLLLYIPLGFFAAFSFKAKNWVWGLASAFLISLFMSTFLEFMQSYNPVRVPSALDIILNTSSGFFGGVLVVLFYEQWVSYFSSFTTLMRRSCLKNPWPMLAFFLILSWGAYQWYPFLPTLHPDYIKLGYAPILQVISNFSLIDLSKLGSYFAQTIALYGLALIAFRKKRLLLIGGFILMILPMKIILMSRVLSFEAIAGCIGGLLLAAIFDLFLTKYLKIASRV